jgi:hypothetical protein
MKGRSLGDDHGADYRDRRDRSSNVAYIELPLFEFVLLSSGGGI